MLIHTYGSPQHFENGDNSSGDFLSFECNVHALPKPLVDPYGVPDLKDPDELYFCYVCIKNPQKSKQKDDKKNRLFLQKEGKKALAKKMKDQRTKINEEGQFAKTPTRDSFGNSRASDVRVKKTEQEIADDLEEAERAKLMDIDGAEGASAVAPRDEAAGVNG